MAQKKPTNPLIIVFAVVAVGFTAFRWYGDFADGRTAGTSAETQQIIDEGGFQLSAEFELDELETTIVVTTVVPQSMMLDAMQPGPTNDKVMAYMMDEADKILAQCEDVPDTESQTCVDGLSFVIPPYRPSQ